MKNIIKITTKKIKIKTQQQYIQYQKNQKQLHNIQCKKPKNEDGVKSKE